MLRALYSAAAGMQSQQLNLDVISNNLANVNTTGFKKSKIEFQELLYQIAREPGWVGCAPIAAAIWSSVRPGRRARWQNFPSRPSACVRITKPVAGSPSACSASIYSTVFHALLDLGHQAAEVTLRYARSWPRAGQRSTVRKIMTRHWSGAPPTTI